MQLINHTEIRENKILLFCIMIEDRYFSREIGHSTQQINRDINKSKFYIMYIFLNYFKN